jgi:cell division protein FtsN
MPTLPKPGPAPNVAGDATPVLAVYPQRRRRQADDDTAETATADRVWLGMPVRNWLYLTAAVVALLAILWAFHPKPSQSAAVTQTTPSTNPANWPARVAEPATPPPATHRSVPIKQNAATPVSVGASASAANNWRVVAYTFNREADAEKRLNTIKSQHPGLDPHIFSPKGNGAPYLVVLGGRMSKDEAGKLRSKARASGLPRDTYIQNYAR